MKRKIRSTINIAYLSLVLSVVALFFSGMQAFDSRAQLLFTVKPSVTFFTLDDLDDPLEPNVGIEINNSGPAPALIKSVTYYVDGKAVEDIRGVVRAGKLNSDETTYVQFEIGDTLAVGESNWILRHYTKGKEDIKERKDFIAFIDDHLGVEVNFCSLLGTCWTKCSIGDRCGKSLKDG